MLRNNAVGDKDSREADTDVTVLPIFVKATAKYMRSKYCYKVQNITKFGSLASILGHCCSVT